MTPGEQLSSLPLETVIERLKEQLPENSLEAVSPFLGELQTRYIQAQKRIEELEDELEDAETEKSDLEGKLRKKEGDEMEVSRSLALLRDAPEGEPQRQARFGFLDALREIEQGVLF